MSRRKSSHVLFPVLVMLVMLACIPSLAAAAPAHPPDGSSTVIDINSAAVEELMTVKGIGRVIAQRIVEFRETNGPFETVDDLLKVKGVGERLLDKIREQLIAGKKKR